MAQLKNGVWPITIGTWPEKGPLSLYAELNLAANVAQDFDLFFEETQLGLGNLQTMFIDASNFLASTANGLKIRMLGTQQQIVLRGRTQGYFPVASLEQVKLTAIATESVIVPVLFLNCPVPAAHWYTA